MVVTYIKISLITMVVSLIVERNNLNETEAILAFYNSKISEKLADKDTGLYTVSPYFLYELWNTEYETGDYTKSPLYGSIF